MRIMIMEICRVCNKEFKDLKSIGLHLANNKDHPNKEEYALKYLNVNNNCKTPGCKNKTKFNRLRSNGNIFFDYCSSKCMNSDPSIREKIKQTNLEKYGVESHNQSEEIKNKKKNVYLEKYGVENISKLDSIKDKKKETCFKNNGVEYPTQSSLVKEKIINSVMKKYNVNHISKSDEIKQKKIQTSIKNFGVEHPLQNSDIRQKIIDTCLKTYGTSSPLKNGLIIDKIKKTRLYFSYKKIKESEKFNLHIEPLFSLEEYTGINREDKYKFKCKKCNKDFFGYLKYGYLPRCLNCYPIMNGTSNSEKEIVDFIKSLDSELEIIENDRKILNGLELDIVIPSHNLAIELNGLYWHSELNGKDKNYHLNKTKLCEEKNIQLIHIFEDEWVEKQEIVKSVIANKLGFHEEIVYSRKCEIKEVTNKECSEFLDYNHLQGSIKSKINIGLFFNNRLISLLTFSKPRYNNKYEYEILRFCNSLYKNIPGSFSKLLKYFENKYKPKNIITYADRRYSNGNVYLKNGFIKNTDSKINYFYLDNNYLNRISRIKFQKHKLSTILETYDSSLTEWQNVQLNGYDRIWDCGNLVFQKQYEVDNNVS